MQVSQMSDTISHAVIGKQESISMGMSDSSALMHILSSTLYTHPKLASVREVICNGWDAHISSGITDRPLVINVSNDRILVQDFGTGIPHDKIGPIYGTYGDSTKRTDSTVTGGFGLGSKAPFAYTDNFEVVSCCQGIKSVYRVSKSSMEVGGKPAINTIVQVPTTKTGITVSMGIKPGDGHEFLSLVKEVLTLGEISAEINGELFTQVLPMSESPTGYIISSMRGRNSQNINIRYGNVVYPVPSSPAYEEEFDQVDQVIDGLWGRANIIFMAPPDAVSIAPSRESLILTDITVQTIKACLAKFNPQEVKNAKVTADMVLKQWINQTIAKEDLPTGGKYLRPQITALRPKYANNDSHSTGPYAYTFRRAHINHMMSVMETTIKGPEILLKRIERASKAGVINTKFAKEIRKAHFHDKNQSSKGWGIAKEDRFSAVFHRNVTAPLYAGIEANDKVTKDRLFFGDSGDYYWRLPEMQRLKLVGRMTMETLVSFLFKRVLLVRSKTAVEDFFRGRNQVDRGGWIIYLVTSHEPSQEEVVKFFEGQGYEVHKKIPPRKVREVKEVDPNAPPKVKVVSAKRKGYLTLGSSNSHGHFFLSTAREVCKPEDEVTDPVAWIILRSKGPTDRLGDFSNEESKAITKLFGKQIAVVTTPQAEALKKKGVPELSQYVYNHVDTTLSERAEFRRFLAFNQFLEPNARDADSVLYHAAKHETLMKSIGLRFSLSAETEMLLTFYREAVNNNYNGRMKDQFPKCIELSKKVKPYPGLSDLKAKMRKSRWSHFIQLGRVSDALKDAVPGSDKCEIPYIIVQNLLK